MSYLDWPRLSFVGRFSAGTNTVNNTLGNFTPGSPIVPGWNPFGGNVFTLSGCKVTWLTLESGPVKGDPILNAALISKDRPYPAKMVDLDPDQRFISEIWGLTVQICWPDGSPALVGDMLVTGLRDMWANYSPLANIGGADPAQNDPQHRALGGLSAAFQSVLKPVQWNVVAKSPFLAALKKSSQEQLSIRFTLDAFDTDKSSLTFATGRIRGTIGPATAAEPNQFPIARRLFNPAYVPGAGPPYGSAFAKVSAGSSGGGTLTIDLSNSIPTTASRPQQGDADPLTSFGGPVKALTLRMETCKPVAASLPPASPPKLAPRLKRIPLLLRVQQVSCLELDGVDSQEAMDTGRSNGGPIDASSAETGPPATGILFEFTIDPAEFNDQAGVFDFVLTPEQVALAERSPLRLLSLGSGGSADMILKEDPEGWYVDCDTPCLRMSPGDSATCVIRTMQFGNPGGQPPSGLPLQVLVNGSEYPLIFPWSSQPPAAISISTGPPSKLPGVYNFTLSADPPQPKPPQRASIDGNVFFLGGPWTCYGLTAQVQGSAASVLLHDLYSIPANPTWADVQPIFAYYARIYPAMTRIIDLSDYEMVRAHAQAIEASLALPVEAGGFMPVSRDLSPQKLDMIRQWFADGMPLGSEDEAQA
ncbi:MAG: hypothetical protein U0790_10330 [Isosphaeraceae bacterium]